MAKVDLHCHSIYSEHPSEWFLQRLGANESYTDPEYIYHQQLENGMDFVTITDHNRMEGVLKLQAKYPQRVITGVESTAYFPEDGCKIHILIFGLNRSQFEVIEAKRSNIYELRDYLVAQKLPHSVAHATYSVNGKLSLEHLKKLILLFNVFEGVNGGRNRLNNESWMRVLENLHQSDLELLTQQYEIIPVGDKPWIKGFSGGSDDHAGLFLGKSYTEASAKTPEQFLQSLWDRQTTAHGRHNDFLSLAFAIYKIGMDFSRAKSQNVSTNLLSQVSEYIFNNKSLSWKYRFKVRQQTGFFKKKKKDDQIKAAYFELLESFDQKNKWSVDERLLNAYHKISDITDVFFQVILDTISKDLSHGNIAKMIRNISSTIPGVFLTTPFFSTIYHMNSNRVLLDNTQKHFNCYEKKKVKKVLWFTDTFEDLNGVAATLTKIHQYASENDFPLTLVSASDNPEIYQTNFLNLPIIREFELPYYNDLMIKVPSLLRSIKKIYDYDPDEIIISTPGPIGLIGLLAAKLLSIKSKGIFHTDFSIQVGEIKQDESLVSLVDSYINYFYQKCDEVHVTTKTYMNILEKKGIDRHKMHLFERGVDPQVFHFKAESRQIIKQKYQIEAEIIFIYTGRISRDKNLDLAIDSFLSLRKKHPAIHLLIVGDGPYRKELEQSAKSANITFTGRLSRDLLADYYSAADLFLFPSITDTYGMSVLEAQACGLPCLVSNLGGPQDVIVDAETGFVLPAEDSAVWIDKISDLLPLISNNSVEWQEMKKQAVANALKKNNWDSFLKEFLQ